MDSSARAAGRQGALCGVKQRNRVVHEYFGVDWVLLWKTVTEDVPRLRDQVRAILDAEFPEEPGGAQ